MTTSDEEQAASNNDGTGSVTFSTVVVDDDEEKGGSGSGGSGKNNNNDRSNIVRQNSILRESKYSNNNNNNDKRGNRQSVVQRMIKSTRMKRFSTIQSSSSREYFFVVTLGFTMAFIAGYSNGVCLSGYIDADIESNARQSVAGVTGLYTASAIDVGTGNWVRYRFNILSILSIMTGACISSLMNPRPVPFELSARFGPTFLLAFCFSALGAINAIHNNTREFYFTAIGNGIMNGISSMYSANLIRTTHLTGTTTDIGLFIGQLLRGNKTNLWKLYILSGLAISFWIGSLTGYEAAKFKLQKSLYMNACFFFAMGCSITAYFMIARRLTFFEAVFGVGKFHHRFDKFTIVRKTKKKKPTTTSEKNDDDEIGGDNGGEDIDNDNSDDGGSDDDRRRVPSFHDEGSGTGGVPTGGAFASSMISSSTTGASSSSLIYEPVSEKELMEIFDELAAANNIGGLECPTNSACGGRVNQDQLLALLADKNMKIRKQRKPLIAMIHSLFEKPARHNDLDGDWTIQRSDWKQLIHEESVRRINSFRSMSGLTDGGGRMSGTVMGGSMRSLQRPTTPIMKSGSMRSLQSGTSRRDIEIEYPPSPSPSPSSPPPPTTTTTTTMSKDDDVNEDQFSTAEGRGASQGRKSHFYGVRMGAMESIKLLQAQSVRELNAAAY